MSGSHSRILDISATRRDANETTLSFNASTNSRAGEEDWDDNLWGDVGDVTAVANGARYHIQSNLKIFNSAVHTMSRFSDNLHFEPSPTGLALKAITNSQSAFASIHFTLEFFDDAEVSRISPDDYNICRVSMRCALATFNAFSKSTVLSYTLHIDSAADVMVVRTAMMHNIGRSSVINLRECAATYRHLYSDKSRLENQVTLSPSVILGVLPQLGVDADELKLIADEEKLTLERYLKNNADRNHFRKSQASLDLERLDHHSIQRPGQVCFRLKEFKAILHFAEECGLPINIYFDSPGKPVIVTLEENIDIVAEFTLGTFSLPSHELERMMLAPRLTEATTLRATMGPAEVAARGVGENEMQPQQPADELQREAGEGVAEQMPYEHRTPETAPPAMGMNGAEERMEAEEAGLNEENDENAEEMRLGESASMMMGSVGGGHGNGARPRRLLRSSLQQRQLQQPPQQQLLMEMDEEEEEAQLQRLPLQSTLEAFQRNFLAMSQASDATSLTHAPGHSRMREQANFFAQEIYDYESPDEDETKDCEGSDGRAAGSQRVRREDKGERQHHQQNMGGASGRSNENRMYAEAGEDSDEDMDFHNFRHS